MTMNRDEDELRQRYLADLVSTSTPAQRLLMLFDRLGRDLVLAAQAFEAKDWKRVNDSLVHAQQVLFALRDPLDRESGLGATLSSVYTFCLNELIKCNIRKEPARLSPVQSIIEQIASANRTAAAAPADANVILSANG